MLDAVAIPHLGDLDRFAYSLSLTEVVAPTVNPQIEFRSPYSKGVHLAVVVAVHLDAEIEVAVRALAAEPEMLPHELGFRRVISSRGAQAHAQHFLHGVSILQNRIAQSQYIHNLRE